MTNNQKARPPAPAKDHEGEAQDFAHVINREKAALGLFITLAEPTRAMKEDKLQILTIKGLLDGTKTARYPDLTRGGLTFKKAKKENVEEQLILGDDVAF